MHAEMQDRVDGVECVDGEGTQVELPATLEELCHGDVEPSPGLGRVDQVPVEVLVGAEGEADHDLAEPDPGQQWPVLLAGGTSSRLDGFEGAASCFAGSPLTK